QGPGTHRPLQGNLHLSQWGDSGSSWESVMLNGSPLIAGLRPVSQLYFSDVTADSLAVSWSAPAPPADRFDLYYGTHESSVESVVILDGSRTKAILSGLLPSRQYVITLVTMHGDTASEPVTGTVLTGTAVLLSIKNPVLHFKQNSRKTRRGVNVAVKGLSSTEKPKVAVLTCLLAVSGGGGGGGGVGGVSNLDQLGHWRVVVSTAGMDAPREMAVSACRLAVECLALSLLCFQELILDAEDTWIRLEGLAETTVYTVRLQAARGLETSAIVSTSFTTRQRLFSMPQNCAQHLLNGELLSSVYTIYINRDPSQGMQVYCDMLTDGGGWIVFQRRQNGLTDFSRKWSDYRTGFGNLEDEFWLGERTQGRYELRIDMRDGQESVYATYDRFSIGDAKSFYKLRIGEYNGTAGDSLSYHQGRPFSTKDRDNDIAVTNCALSYKGAWWYKNCHRANLNGKYGESRHSQGINWHKWKGHEFSIPFVEMKTRPFNYRETPAADGHADLYFGFQH
uniref:Tenascin XB n=1 Tax=Electrophorus electricus TaxID=8005 RepID=A0A4W4EEJ7_ELEEL